MKQHKYTPEQREFINNNVRGVDNYKLTTLFNAKFNLDLSVEQIKSYKKNHNLNSGLNGRFKKGNTPKNKGTKGFMKANKTSFKKGHVPKNHRPVGSERVDSKDGYSLVKVAEPNKWKLKHRVIYEEHHGKIPKGYVLIFGDGDITNFNLDNLILVHRRELLMLNQENLIQKDAELTKTAVNIAKLKIKVQEVKNK